MMSSLHYEIEQYTNKLIRKLGHDNGVKLVRHDAQKVMGEHIENTYLRNKKLIETAVEIIVKEKL